MTNASDTTTTPHPPIPRRPRRSRRRTGQAWGDDVPTLATLAAPQGLRVYRDACGDENLPGRFGEIFRHGPGCLAVQFGGVRANGRPIRPPWPQVQWRLRRARRLAGLRRVRRGDAEVIFHFPDALLPAVAQLIEAYRAYRAAGPSATGAQAA